METTNEAPRALAQLRHLYAQMVDGSVRDTAQAARRLLGPAIERLEREAGDRDRLAVRLRETAQILISEFGADGPMDAEDAARRAVAEAGRLRAGLSEAAGRAEEIRDASTLDAGDRDGMLEALADEAREVAAGDKPHLLHLADDEIKALRKQLAELERDLVCLRWSAALISEGRAAELLGMDRVAARGVHIAWMERNPRDADELETMLADSDPAKVREQKETVSRLTRERDEARAIARGTGDGFHALRELVAGRTTIFSLTDVGTLLRERDEAWETLASVGSRDAYIVQRARADVAEARAEALATALRASKETLRAHADNPSRDLLASALGIVEVALARDAISAPPAGQVKQEIRIVFDGPPGHEAGRFVEVEDAEGRSIGASRWEQKGDLWHLVIAATPPADLTQHPAYRAGVEAGIEQSAKACEEVTGAPMWAAHFANRVRDQLDTKVPARHQMTGAEDFDSCTSKEVRDGQ